MEKQVLIKQQFDLQRREYKTPSGENRIFESKGFILTDGLDTFYAEMTGRQAVECGTLDPAQPYIVQCEMQVRSWNTQDGSTAYATTVYINRLKIAGIQN